MGFFKRAQSQRGDTGWAALFVGDLYDRRWFEAGVATERVERNGRELTDPVPPGLRIIGDADQYGRFLATPADAGSPNAEGARRYFDAKVKATATTLAFPASETLIRNIQSLAVAVFLMDGLSLLDRYDANPALRHSNARLGITPGDTDIIPLLEWWMALASRDDSGGTSMFLHISMDKAMRLGFEDAGALPRANT